MRDEAVAAYGGCCECCDEGEPLFLTIDHVDGPTEGETGKRRSTGKAYGMQLFGFLKRAGYPPGYRVLCFNCNCGRERNEGVCPHQR